MYKILILQISVKGNLVVNWIRWNILRWCKEWCRERGVSVQAIWKQLYQFFTVKKLSCFVIIPPANEVAGVYSDPYVCPFVRPSVRPSQSLIRYSSKTAEQNFMKLSGIVHYMMPYCTSYFKSLSPWFWGFPEQNKDFAIQNMGEWGYHFMSIAHSICS